MPFGVGIATILDAVLGGNASVVKEALGMVRMLEPSAVAREFLERVAPGFIREGLSANKTLTLLRRVGAGIRRQDFLKLYKEAQEYVRVQDYVQGLDMGEQIDVSQSRTKDLPYGDKYTAKVWVRWRDDLTGELHEQYMTMGVNEGETKSELFGRLRDSMSVWYSMEGEPYRGEIDDWGMEDLVENPSYEEPWGLAL
jgi:hypothetical protein